MFHSYITNLMKKTDPITEVIYWWNLRCCSHSDIYFLVFRFIFVKFSFYFCILCLSGLMDKRRLTFDLPPTMMLWTLQARLESYKYNVVLFWNKRFKKSVAFLSFKIRLIFHILRVIPDLRFCTHNLKVLMLVNLLG